MRAGDALVTVALPVYNGGATLARVVESVLGQTHPYVELLICDNASTDETETIARRFAAADRRVVYHRHRTNIGLLNNFRSAADMATGSYLRWIGDSDSISEDYVARALEVFGDDPRRVLVTTQVTYLDPLSGTTTLNQSYVPLALASLDPVERLAELLHVATSEFALLDPLYGLMRRDVARLPRRNMVGEDQVFAARLALAGPWGHVPAPLAWRQRSEVPSGELVELLGVPGWQAHLRDVLQCRELLSWIQDSSLGPDQRRRARGEVARFYLRRKTALIRRGILRVRHPGRRRGATVLQVGH